MVRGYMVWELLLGWRLCAGLLLVFGQVALHHCKLLKFLLKILFLSVRDGESGNLFERKL